MAIRWKSKLALMVWLLLFTYGLSGMSIGLTRGDQYLKGDYFKTGEFEAQLDSFINYLNLFELDYLSRENAKKAIFVTDEEINEHRTRYGDLPTQIANIKGQYEVKIQEALHSKNQDIANMYIAERDRKIADITNNFKSDEYVRVKIVKEKEQKIEEYYQELERNRPEYLRMKGAFHYYLKDTTTGAVYTNLTTANDVDPNKLISSTKMMFIRNYPSAKNGSLSTEGRLGYYGNQDPTTLFKTQGPRVFEGAIGVPKSSVAVSSVLVNYEAYQQKQMLFYVYTITSLIALLVSILLYRTGPIAPMMDVQKLQNYYSQVPIDVRLVSFAFIAYITFILLITWNGAFHLYEYLYDFVTEILFRVVIMAFFVGLTLSQGKLLLAQYNSWEDFSQDWHKSLLARAYRGLQEAFAIRSIGTKFLLIAIFIFVFGMGFGMVIMEVKLIVLYLPVCVIIGLPAAIWIFRRIGYFNQIVRAASELAQGNYDADLPVKGKSVLASLAGSINKMKYGVKTSQREQAKSERLKTELITNVSHDLRTPLTSIITYTELLKQADLAPEDRKAYIQIIDRTRVSRQPGYYYIILASYHEFRLST